MFTLCSKFLRRSHGKGTSPPCSRCCKKYIVSTEDTRSVPRGWHVCLYITGTFTLLAIYSHLAVKSLFRSSFLQQQPLAGCYHNPVLCEAVGLMFKIYEPLSDGITQMWACGTHKTTKQCVLESLSVAFDDLCFASYAVQSHLADLLSVLMV